LRGSADGPRVTPAHRERISQVQRILGAAVRRFGVERNSMKGKARREAWRLLGGGNLWKSKPKGVTGMKQGRKGAGGMKRQEVEKT